jgi:hypothetical protein
MSGFPWPLPVPGPVLPIIPDDDSPEDEED